MSKLSRATIMLTPANIDIMKKRVKFKMLSVKTVVFTISYFGLAVGVSLVSYLTEFSQQLSNFDQTKTKSIIDTGSKFASYAVMAASQAFPFLIAHGTPSISGLALAHDLTSPKYGRMLIFGNLLTPIASSLGKIYSSKLRIFYQTLKIYFFIIAFYVHLQPVLEDPANEYPTSLIILNTSLSFASYIIGQIYFGCICISLMSWMNKLTTLNQYSGQSFHNIPNP